MNQSGETLISISEASNMLGVSEVTLRQWTDEGKIKVFITPGGHRRYSRADLKKFMSSHRRVLGIKDLVTELEDTVQIHGEIDRESLKTAHWYHRLSEAEQEYFAHLGRELLNLIIRYITEPSKRQETLKLVRDVGRNFGETLAKLGLPLTDSVEAFIRHRGPVIDATLHLMRKREAFTGRVMESIPLVAQVMDEALVSLVAAHQQHRNSTHSPGGTTS